MVSKLKDNKVNVLLLDNTAFDQFIVFQITCFKWFIHKVNSSINLSKTLNKNSFKFFLFCFYLCLMEIGG